MNCIRLALFWGAFAFASGCSVINVYSNGVKVSNYVGIPIYSLKPDGEAIYFDVTGFGLINSPGGVSLGYMQQVYAQIPFGTCSVVIFAKSSAQSRDLLEHLKKAKIDPDKVCLTHNRE